MMLVSALFRTSVANPEKRTGMQWSWCTRNAAAGLPRCPLASPADSTAPRDFLCSATLRRMLGMLQEVFRITPTCSTSLVKLTGTLLRVIRLQLSASLTSSSFDFEE